MPDWGEKRQIRILCTECDGRGEHRHGRDGKFWTLPCTTCAGAKTIMVDDPIQEGDLPIL